LLDELRAYKHTAWEYAAQYQLAMFYASESAVRDLHSALQSLEALIVTANHNRDLAMSAFAEVVCSFLFLQTSSPEAVTSSQQALARVRALSAHSEVSSIPQIMLMMEFVDLCCSVRESNHKDTSQKRERMSKMVDATFERGGWAHDGDTLYIPIQKKSLRGVQTQVGGLVQERQGQSVLPFSWMDTDAAEAWAFLLSAMSRSHKAASDEGKTETFIKSGLDRLRKMNTTSRDNKLLSARFLIELVFVKCGKDQWSEAKEAIAKLEQRMKEIDETGGFALTLPYIVAFLKGAIEQGLGNLEAALKAYSNPMLDLAHFRHQSDSSAIHRRTNDSEHETIRNIAILSGINRLQIINVPSHPRHHEVLALKEDLTILANASQDANVKTAYKLIHGIMANTGVLRAKQTVIDALNAAREVSNLQLTALVLMTMFQFFFVGATDEHAVKCLKAVATQTQLWGSPMWRHVTAGLQAQQLEFQQKSDGARERTEVARKMAELLPEEIRKKIQM
jgi:hypothetical protein